MLLRRVCVGLLFCMLSQLGNAQTGDPAARIYQRASPDVFVILLRDSKGNPVSFGSGFLIAKNTLVTNFHVVEGGSVFLSQGPINIPARVEKTDRENDLAILHIDADIDAIPLSLSEKNAAPGENVFAIGNPEGLEKSISAGIVAANRDLDGRALLQITAPLSHGSSGGPVLNSSGEVVGVSVAVLKEGQNLNFAVPAAKVRALLMRETTSQPDVAGILDQVEKLEHQQKDQQGDQWTETKNQIVSLLRSAMTEAGSDEKLLLRISDEAGWEDADLAVASANRAVSLKSDAESNLALGKAYKNKAWIDIMVNHGRSKAELRTVARAAFEQAIKSSRKPTSEMYFSLGDVLEDLESYATAESNFRHALEVAQRSVPQPPVDEIIRGLVRVTYSQKKLGDSESWFKALVDRNLANALDWSGQAKREFDSGEYAEAGDAYNKAASLGGDWDNLCDASYSYFSSDRYDAALSTARQCIAAGTGKQDSENNLAFAHRAIAIILDSRGVFGEALTNAREAVDLDPSEPWGFEAEANALLGLRRFQEATTAANQAVRLADGKYSNMHFTLGLAYFNQENWEFARQSFEKAAELDQSSTDAPYNLALCFANLNDKYDAAKWFKEVLRRAPDYPERAEVRRRISVLTAGLE